MNLMGADPVLHTRAGLGENDVAAFCVVAAVKTGGCGGSGGRSVSTGGAGGSCPCRRARLGGSALASELLGGFEAVLVACDSWSLHPSAWIRALTSRVPVTRRC